MCAKFSILSPTLHVCATPIGYRTGRHNPATNNPRASVLLFGRDMHPPPVLASRTSFPSQGQRDTTGLGGSGIPHWPLVSILIVAEVFGMIAVPLTTSACTPDRPEIR